MHSHTHPTSRQVRAQLLELSSLQQSLAAQEEELRRVRQAYEAQVAAAASQASNAQEEVAELVGEIADMQVGGPGTGGACISSM